MTNEIILQKAVEEAKKNGYKGYMDNWELPEHQIWFENSLHLKTYYRLIFSHDFAKAFWPGNKYCPRCECLCGGDYCPDHDDRFTLSPSFQYHLREMIIEEDPLQYVAEFI